MKQLHTVQTTVFKRAAAQNKLHHAWLLCGPEGIGKATWARQCAASLLEIPFEHLEYHTHFLALGSRENPLTIDAFRDAQSFFTHIPLEPKPKIVLIDHLDSLHHSTVNALLKCLEEPPSYTLFLLVSHRPYQLLSTIKSRAITLRFKRLNHEETEEIVKEHLESFDLEAYGQALQYYPGQPGRIIGFLKNNLQAFVKKCILLLEGNEVEFDSEDEKLQNFYLFSKLIHQKNLKNIRQLSPEIIFKESPNKVINDCFIYNLDKKNMIQNLSI